MSENKKEVLLTKVAVAVANITESMQELQDAFLAYTGYDDTKNELSDNGN